MPDTSLSENYLQNSSFEMEPENIESLEIDSHKTDIFEEAFLEKTYSLYAQGLNIGEIAEIEGLSVKNVYRQFEKLILIGKVKKIEGLVPSERQEQIKSALKVLETEIDSMIRAKVGKGCREEELKLIRSLLLANMLSST
ncbi:hypothetical protein SDC9_169833 [bioreactor metagenome]|uniref:Helicase Helix-turn-helix domain-containing protein n=1 Tax=bioreactor metagenome TaxID=1076179 RepID=A0A645G8X1_9ZZZZ